jgi:hypothetical protein
MTTTQTPERRSDGPRGRGRHLWRTLSAAVSVASIGAALVLGVNVGASGPLVSPVQPAVTSALVVPATPAVDSQPAEQRGGQDDAARANDRGRREQGRGR